MTRDFLRAALDNNASRAAQQLQITLPANWPNPYANLLSRRMKQLEDEPTLQPWLLRAVVLRQSAQMVGHIGFHTGPDPEYLRPYSAEAIEFGYTVYPPFRRQGYAREAVTALMCWATDTHGVKNFIVSIRPDNAPSQNLARQLGFVRIGSHIDEVDGVEDILELRASNNARSVASN